MSFDLYETGSRIENENEISTFVVVVVVVVRTARRSGSSFLVQVLNETSSPIVPGACPNVFSTLFQLVDFIALCSNRPEVVHMCASIVQGC